MGERSGKAIIRPAKSCDLEEIASVWHRSAGSMNAAPAKMPSRDDMRARIETELVAGWELYVAEHDGGIVGLLALKPTEAVLDQIFVLPEFKGSGFGADLLNFAKQRLSDGFDLRMASANKSAGRFYEHHGLNITRIGDHPATRQPVTYYRWDPR